MVLTPHIAGSTQETWREAFDLMQANLSAFLAHRPLPTPVGTMHGEFNMVTAKGEKFDARIEPFRLAVPRALN